MVTYSYYVSVFGGDIISEQDFPRIASAAFDILSLAATKPLTESDGCLRAQCYEAELIEKNGGMDAVYNIDVTAAGRETLGDYSVQYSAKNVNSRGLNLIAGMPLSPIAYVYLQREGLTNRVIADFELEGDGE